MIRNEVFGWALKLWAICVICFFVFCISRALNHFPKHEVSGAVQRCGFAAEADTAFPKHKVSGAVIIYEAKKTAGNSYEIIRRVR